MFDISDTIMEYYWDNEKKCLCPVLSKFEISCWVEAFKKAKENGDLSQSGYLSRWANYLLDDSLEELEAELTKKFSQAITLIEDDDYLNGMGVNLPEPPSPDNPDTSPEDKEEN